MKKKQIFFSVIFGLLCNANILEAADERGIELETINELSPRGSIVSKKEKTVVTSHSHKANFDLSNLPTEDLERIMRILKRNKKTLSILPPEDLNGDFSDMEQVKENIENIYTYVASTSPEGALRILSIDGGGTRGIIALRMLVELERLTGKQAYQLFDHIAATSTGSIIATCLTVRGISYPELGIEASDRPMTAQQALDLFNKLAPTIFGKNRGYLSKTHTKYDEQPFKKILEQLVGQTRLSDCVPDMTVTSYNIASHKPVIASSLKAKLNPEADKSLVDIILSSTAAPTYFLPTDSHHIDGGLFFNNPSIVATLISWKYMKKDPGEHILVSLGNGVSNTPSSRQDFEKLYISGILGKVMDIVFNGTNSEKITKILHKIFNDDDLTSNYFRIQAYLPDDLNVVDRTDPITLKKLYAIAEEKINSSPGLFQSIADVLLRKESAGNITNADII